MPSVFSMPTQWAYSQGKQLRTDWKRTIMFLDAPFVSSAMEYDWGIYCDSSNTLHKQMWFRTQWDIVHSFFPHTEYLKSNLHNVYWSHRLLALSIIPNCMLVHPPKIPAALARIWRSGAWLTSQNTPGYQYSGTKILMDLFLPVIVHELVKQIHILFVSIHEELSEIQVILWLWWKIARNIICTCQSYLRLTACEPENRAEYSFEINWCPDYDAHPHSPIRNLGSFQPEINSADRDICEHTRSRGFDLGFSQKNSGR